MKLGRKRAMTLAVLASAIAVSWRILFLAKDLQDTPIWASAIFPLFDFAAALNCFRAARAQSGTDRKAWLCFAFACFSFGCGEVIWGFYNIAYGISVPTPCLADLGYLGFPVFAIAGIWLYRGPAGPRANTVVHLGNLGIIFSAIVLGYVFLFQGLLLAAQSTEAALVEVAYGVVSMAALCFGLTVTSLHIYGRKRFVLSLIVFGLASMTATFFTFTYALLEGSYNGVDPINLLYLIAASFFFWAAFEQQHLPIGEASEHATSNAEDRARRLETLLPAMAVAGVLIATFVFRDTLNKSSLPYVAASALLFVISLAQRNWWGHKLETRLRDEAMASQAQLTDANRVLYQEMQARAQAQEELRQSQKMEALGQLTGGVAHDFNNLLAVILSNLEMAADECAEEKTGLHTFLQDASDAAQRGASLTQRLLALSRKQALRPETFDVNALLCDMQSLLARTLGERTRVRILGGEGTWPCAADRAQLENSILNLAINARDAMPQGGDLTFETSNITFDEADAAEHPDLHAGSYTVIAVRDSGTGMAPEILTKAFEPFFTTKSVGEGTGLGLSMVYGFTKQSGGHIAIESQLGAGTVVRVYLPKSESEVVEAKAEERFEGPRGRGESVLVVEDEPAVRKLVITLLEDLGYQVVAASNGTQALSTLEALDSLDLLLSDVVLPGGVSGRELARRVEEQRSEVSILLMSGYAAEVLLKDGALSPGTELLHKPFHKAELARKVRETLDNRDRNSSLPSS